MIVAALRPLAALLTGLSGAAQVASLWFRPLQEAALLDAVAGSLYLLLALGLAGSSRFSLFLGIALPSGMLALQLSQGASGESLAQLRLAVDLLVPMLCALLLLLGLRQQR